MAEAKHGLSIEYLKSNGYKFSQILNSGLIHMLNDAEYIISHNTTFDYYILLNELNRFKLKNTIRNLIDIRTQKKLLCTCKLSGYSTLDGLYKKIFNESPDVSHRAGEDVKTLVEIITREKLPLEYKLILD